MSSTNVTATRRQNKPSDVDCATLAGGTTMSARRLLYYPLVEQGVYPSVAAACAAIGRPAGALDEYVANAAVEASEMVVCDRIALGNPALKVGAVLSFGEGGEVSLWAGFFGELSECRADAVAFLEMRGRAGWTGRQAVGEWRPDGPVPADVKVAWAARPAGDSGRRA